MSQRAMLAWLNDTLELSMRSITEMSAGWQYCQLVDLLFTKALPLQRVIFNARNEEQKLSNFKLLMTFLAKHQVEYPSASVDVQRLVKGQQTHNLAFLTWFKRWFDEMCEGEETPEYAAAERRQQFQGTAPSQGTPAKTFAPKTNPARKRKASALTSPEAEDTTARCLPMEAVPTPRVSLETPRGSTPAGPAMQFIMKFANMDVNTAQRLPKRQKTEDVTANRAAAVADNAAQSRLREENRKAQDELKKSGTEKAQLLKQMKELEEKLKASAEGAAEAELRAKTAERQERSHREEKKEKEGELRDLKEKVNTLKRDVEAATNQLRDRDSTLEKAAAVRRMLHNSLQELKGNIRVFARLRPTLDAEDSFPSEVFTFPDELDSRRVEICEPAGTSVTGEKKNGKVTNFEFDKVFPPNASQECVFDEVSNLVQSSLDGYKVCIFAYGQTGSGKTHTMEGLPQDQGLIPRAVNLLFDRSKEMRERGWTMTLKARYVEIYNDKLRDLLGSGAEDKIEVKHTGDDTHLTNCAIVDVTDCESVHKVLLQAKSRRTTAATKMNERSSRSHSVFTLKIYGRNEGTGQKMASEINLIDLAGSERVKDSGVTGEALKEAEHINTSLTHLGNVIQQLHGAGRVVKSDKGASKLNHIFRNSTLTWLLKSCLGGDCKTLMLVNISPVLSSLPETTNSLRFATKVNNCQIGTASKRVK